jgi:hypothetical protein
MMNLDFPEEQFFLDINWYFTDSYNRLCVVASGGGVLPRFLFQQESQNDEFHNLVNDLPERYEIGRNENILELIVDLEAENLNQYFRDFESLAKKGFYVFDKIDLSKSEETNYILVAYPIYNSNTDSLPIERDKLELVPNIKEALISRTNERFSSKNFRIMDLVSILNNQ